MGTREISAWSNYADTLMASYGVSIALWGINHLFDNEGGMWHEIYFRYIQLMLLTPLISVLQTLKIKNAYALSHE